MLNVSTIYRYIPCMNLDWIADKTMSECIAQAACDFKKQLYNWKCYHRSSKHEAGKLWNFDTICKLMKMLTSFFNMQHDSDSRLSIFCWHIELVSSNIGLYYQVITCVIYCGLTNPYQHTWLTIPKVCFRLRIVQSQAEKRIRISNKWVDNMPQLICFKMNMLWN